ncbi:hypothetical protein Hanom_Chr03g00235601 [Helianthus anomalus]
MGVLLYLVLIRLTISPMPLGTTNKYSNPVCLRNKRQTSLLSAKRDKTNVVGPYEAKNDDFLHVHRLAHHHALQLYPQNLGLHDSQLQSN